jgi:two-component system alkaline phosphatase synthesis response regulator PhoP
MNNEGTSDQREYWMHGYVCALISTKEPKNIVEDGDVAVDLDKFAVIYKGVEMSLPKKVTQLLHYLISNKNKILRRDDILYDIWGKDVWVGERTVDVHIRKIKIAIPDNCILSVKGIGYRWN